MRPTEFRNPKKEVKGFRIRLGVAAVVVVIALGVLLARFFYLQVLQHDYYHTLAEENRISVVPIVPNRGLILDRNGEVLAHNYSAYTLEITPGKVGDLDATIDELADVVEIQPKDRKRFRKLLEESKNFESCPSAPGSPTRRWRDSPPTATASPASISRRACSASTRTAKSPRTSSATSAASTRPTWKRSRTRTPDANYKGTDHIGKIGIEGATRTSCTASPAASRSRSTPAAAPCARSRAPRRSRATTWSLTLDTQAAARGREGLRRLPRRAGGASTRPRAACWPGLASPATTPTCSSTASTRPTGTRSTTRPTSP